MSISELTRSSFQSGISAKQWTELCKLLIERKAQESGEQISSSRQICDSVLALLINYPAEPTLETYLREAVNSALVSRPVFAAAFLQGARSPELHDPTTLDHLCSIVLESHYASGLPPLGSLVSLTDPQPVNIATVQDVLSLYRFSQTVPPSAFHRLPAHATELAVLMLSCVNDVSELSTAQAMVYYGELNEILHSCRPPTDLREALDTYGMSLSLLIGDDAKAAREAQMMHSMQLSLVKEDAVDSKTESNVVPCGMLLQHLVIHRSTEFGSGNDSGAVAMMIAVLRWTGWTPAVYYTQLLLAALVSVSQSTQGVNNDKSFFLWRAFVVGRLPRLISMFEKALEGHSSSDMDWRSAMHIAVTNVLRRTDLVSQCNQLAKLGVSESQDAPNSQERPLTRELLQQLLFCGLIDHSFVVTVDPTIANDGMSRLQAEALEHNANLETYLDSKLAAEASEEDNKALLERINQDVASHAIFAEVVFKRFSGQTSSSGDIEVLSHISKLLYTYDAAMDLVALHVSFTDLLFHALESIHNYDNETVGDPQTAVSQLGDVINFVQLALSRFKILSTTFTKDGRTVSAACLRSADVIYRLDALTGESVNAFSVWFKAIFDSNSEGIDDALLRSTKPEILLNISATLFSRSSQLLNEQKIERDVLHNGVSYFLGRLLNWTLVGVMRALVSEIGRRGYMAPAQLEVLCTLLQSPSCPEVVLRLCAFDVWKLLSNKRVYTIPNAALKANIATSRAVAGRVLGFKDDGNAVEPDPTLSETDMSWLDYPTSSVRSALSDARAQKVPSIDVTRCLASSQPTQFLHMLFSELSRAALGMGLVGVSETEAVRSLATSVLSFPRTWASSSPPLLPLFVHVVVPRLIATVEQQ
ncbi:hypothetical protein CONPUDRAFT_141107, partial [Coniophora puteana RWD-64-598 SS2]